MQSYNGGDGEVQLQWWLWGRCRVMVMEKKGGEESQ